MHHLDLRVQLLVGIVLAIITTQHVETFLRFVLLGLSIIYTIYKLYDRFQEKKKTK